MEPPLDTVWADLRDAEGFVASARQAAALGFQGKMCIHPDQIAAANAAFTPDEAAVAQARRIVAAFEKAEAEGLASIQLDGQFIDYPNCAARPQSAGSRSMIDVQALEGCKVLDVSTFLAGPFCATQLGEFGADVIKIELPKVGDATRRFGTMTDCGDSLPWLSESRNKRCITLDLRKPDGAALLKRLIAQSDVIVENFQPGTLEKWGVGYDVLERGQPEADHGSDFRLWPDRSV